MKQLEFNFKAILSREQNAWLREKLIIAADPAEGYEAVSLFNYKLEEDYRLYCKAKEEAMQRIISKVYSLYLL